MKIKSILDQSRRDFKAVYVCEHCGAEHVGRGYDDRHFHDNVIPKMVCDLCNQTAPDNYRALTTKYPDGEQV